MEGFTSLLHRKGGQTLQRQESQARLLLRLDAEWTGRQLSLILMRW